MVGSKLLLEWSTRQIAGWLKCTYPDDENYQVSHEIIYRTPFNQARGALKKKLLQHLRRADHANDMYVRFQRALAEEGAGNLEEAKKLFAEIAGFNFNSMGFTLVRKDAAARASQ